MSDIIVPYEVGRTLAFDGWVHLVTIVFLLSISQSVNQSIKQACIFQATPANRNTYLRQQVSKIKILNG